MRRTVFSTMVMAIALVAMAAIAIARKPILVNYQVQLNGSTSARYRTAVNMWN